MLDCRACFWRGIRAIARDSDFLLQYAAGPQSHRSNRQRLRTDPQRRHQSTAAVVPSEPPYVEVGEVSGRSKTALRKHPAATHIRKHVASRIREYDTYPVGQRRFPQSRNKLPPFKTLTPSSKTPALLPKTPAIHKRQGLKTEDIRWFPGHKTHLANKINRLKGDGDLSLVPASPKALVNKDWQQSGHLKPATVDERTLKHTLKHLEDPFKLSEHVRILLAKKKVSLAYALLQYASKSMNCVLAWNALVQWHLAHGKMTPAVKIYNEMKKRAQWPDSYTYRHLLQGLGKLAHYPSSVPRALSIFYSMFADNARTQPNTFHLNAMLKCCAQAGDMDAMWGVVSNIGTKGIKADSATYCIILNALQRHAIESLEAGANSEETAWHFDHVVKDGRKIWADVVAKWKEMELTMDDLLVCAMGRLLLLSWRPRDWDDIFSLLCQAEGIPRVVPIMGTEARKAADAYLGTPTGDFPATPAEMTMGQRRGQDTARGEEFDPQLAPALGAGSLPLPTNNTLSLALEVCLKLVSKKVADQYWANLTKSKRFGIVPDSDNFHIYLRILRQHKSSGQALKLVCDEIPNTSLQVKTFRIAMSACARNAQRHGDFGAVEHASKLVQLMSERLTSPDPRSLTMYLELVADRKEPKAIIKAIHNVEAVVAKHVSWQDRQKLQALEGNEATHLADLCKCVIRSITYLYEGKHIVKGSTGDKGWAFTRRKYEILIQNLDTKKPKATRETSDNLPSKSVNARNVKKLLRLPPPNVSRHGVTRKKGKKLR